MYKGGKWGKMENDLGRARFGPFEVDLHTHELWKFGTRLKLIGQPFEILAVLLARPGELVTREELRTRLWSSDTFVDFNHGLNAAVNKLREALSDSAENPRYIETLPRRGYRFMAAVEWTGSGNVEPHAPGPDRVLLVAEPSFTAGNSPVEMVAEVPDPKVQSPRRSLRYGIAAAAILIMLLGGALLHRLVPGQGTGASAHPLVERTRALFSIYDTNTPAFSPDGNSVAFYRQHSAVAQAGIYETAVGSDQFVQLTNNDDDCCPVWSPDGSWIAFSRAHNHQYSIYLVPADGGGEQKLKTEKTLSASSGAFKLTSTISVERRLDTGAYVPRRGEIDWSPDGKSIVFAGPSGLYVINIETSSVRPVTHAPPLSEEEDWGPKFSPDGKTILFVRDHQIGHPNEIRTVSVSGGDWVHIFTEPGKIGSPPYWSDDGKSIVFSSNRTGHSALWRVAVDSPDSAVQISTAGPAWDPAVSRRGYRLAFERLQRSLSIWQLDLSNPEEKHPYLVVSGTSDTDQGPGPQFSPDGKKLAYMSDRSGTIEIWISNRDGSSPFQLSAVGGAGTPRWSPDSQSVVFDVGTPDGSKVVNMNLHGGAPRILTPEFHNVCPSWSRDGKWIYFASPRSGDWQVWKVPADGGAALQVTLHGGHAALESLDGTFLYYAKNSQPEPEIWRVPVGGGSGEEKPMPLVRPGTWASWQVVEEGILFVGPALGHQAVLSFYDFAKDRTTTVALLDRIPFWLGATPDGETVAFDQPGQEQAQAMLIENFR